MDREVARQQSLDRLHERRKQVIQLHRQEYGVMHIVELTWLSYPTVRSAIDRYQSGGLTAIKPSQRGKAPGTGRLLSEAQEWDIQRIICDEQSEQLKMDFARWNRAAVMHLIGGNAASHYRCAGWAPT